MAKYKRLLYRLENFRKCDRMGKLKTKMEHAMIRKTVIITGASGDIGEALAGKFAAEGYNLALCCNKNNVEYDGELEEKYKIECKSYKMDIRDYSQVESVLSKIFSDFKSVDSLVCNAGISQKRKLIIDVTNDEIDDLVDTNLKGTIACTREFVKHTMGKSANIVLVSSFVASYGCACESVYSATKSGMLGFVKSLANELGNFEIRVNAVAPGFIDTKMNNNLTAAEKEDIADMTPLKRLGSSSDVADLVYFLSSDSSSFITGQMINIDGGYIPL